MKKSNLMSIVTACATFSAFTAFAAGVFGDTPDSKHAWSVHDRNRPNPVKISAEVGKAPGDAIVLFDGTRESFEKNWCDKKGRPSKWSLGKEGDFYCLPGGNNGGNILTRKSFGDCQLHIEFRHPKEEGITSGRRGAQMHGNSGVFLMSKYEVQVLESFGTDPADMKNPNYADGQAGAIYSQNPPLVNPARRPGEWQTYDIIFHQPVWDGKKLLHPASITVLFNGVVVQDHWEMDHFTTYRVRTPVVPHAKRLPISLQDHGCRVHYRNIWIRELPSRYADRANGGPGVDEKEVMKQRRATAARLYSKIAKPVEPSVGNMQALGEVISYAREGEFEKMWKETAEKFHDVLDKMSDSEWNAKKKSLLSLRNSLDVLIRNGVVPKSCGTRMRINAAAQRLGWNK